MKPFLKTLRSKKIPKEKKTSNATYVTDTQGITLGVIRKRIKNIIKDLEAIVNHVVPKHNIKWCLYY